MAVWFSSPGVYQVALNTGTNNKRMVNDTSVNIMYIYVQLMPICTQIIILNISYNKPRFLELELVRVI